MLTSENFIGRGDDSVGKTRLESPRLFMRECGGLLDPDLSDHERFERPKPTNREILNGTERLHAIQGVDGDFECTERIFFGASLGGHGRVG